MRGELSGAENRTEPGPTCPRLTGSPASPYPAAHAEEDRVIDRRTFLGAMAGGLLAAPLAGEAQPAGKVPDRVWLLARLPVGATFSASFRQALREPGLRGGPEHRHRVPMGGGEVRAAPRPRGRAGPSQGRRHRLRLATQATWRPRTATRTIPIVMVAVGDPLGTGLVASLARPGGNVTGLSVNAGRAVGKAAGTAQGDRPQGLPRGRPLESGQSGLPARAAEQTEAAARALGVQLQLLEARSPDEFDGAFAAMTRERAGALSSWRT